MKTCPWCGCELEERADRFYCENCDMSFDEEECEEDA